MANEIKVNIAASDSGSIAQVTNSAKKLNSELEKAKKNASGLRPAGQTAAVSGANTDIEANRLAKGISGASGAAGRDFAKQAQGLGGLVHVYATFAANVFAVSAAFTALSKAADYDNMLKGLDQLGAASGKNLGAISKNVVVLTDGAISLKEAMGAVAQASAAGMSGQQIERMATVAKKASQALGRDMTDSINRLSRGITKMEPELLDELGIFVRVDKAVADYAKTVGKTANSLTDFERRQAFANAALKQSEDKFGAIDLASNSFSKLQASVVDLLYSGGTLLNKVLGPIAEVMSSSPTALGASLLAVVALLTRQALPALAEFRNGLNDSATRAGEVAKGYAEQAKASRIKNLEAYKKIAEEEAEAKSAALEAKDKGIAAKDSAKGKKVAGWAKDLIQNPNIAREVTPEQLKKLDEYGAKTNKISKTYRDIAQAIREAQIAEEKYDMVVDRIATENNRRAPAHTTEGMNQRIADRAQRASLSSSAISDAANAANVGGMTAGYRTLNDSIKKARKEAEEAGNTFGALQAGVTRTKGILAITATSITKVISAFGWVGMAIGAAAAAYELAAAVFSKNTKQLGEYNKALEEIASSIELVGKTSDVLSKRDPLERLSAQSLEAKANSILGLGESLEKVVDTFDKVEQASNNWFDSLSNGISRMWGGDRASKIATELTGSIKTALVNINSPEVRSKLDESLNGLLGKGRGNDFDKLKMFAELGDVTTLQKVAKAIKEAGLELSNTASRAKEFVDTLDQAVKASQALVTSLAPSDLKSKFGIELINTANKLSSAIMDAEAATSQLYELLKDNQRMSILPDQAFVYARSFKEEVQDTVDTIGRQKEAIILYQKELQKLQEEDSLNPVKWFNTQAAIKDIKGAIDIVNKDIKANQQKSVEYVAKMANILYDAGAERLTAALSAAHQQAALDYASTIAKAAGGVVGATMEKDIAMKRISIEEQLIKASYLQAEQIAKNNLILERDYQERTSKGDKDADKRNVASTRVAQIDRALAMFGTTNVQSKIVDLTSDRAGPPVLGNVDSAALKKDMGSVAQAQIGRDTQLAGLAGKKNSAAFEGDLKIYEETYKVAQDFWNNEKKGLETKLSEVEAARSISGAYDEKLEASAISLKSSIAETDTRLMELKFVKELTPMVKAKIALGDSEKGRQEALQISHKESLNIQEKSNKEKSDGIKLLTDQLTTSKNLAALELSRLENTKALVDLQKTASDKLAAAGLITGSANIENNANRDIRMESRKYDIEIAQLERDKEAAEGTAREGQFDQVLEKKKVDKQLSIEKLKIERDYQAALVRTEETLKNIEVYKSNQGNYVAAAAQDFNNKITDLVNASKSAASAFNENFINAIDSSIDKFYEAIVNGTASMKDVVATLKEGFKNSVKEALAQNVKNLWKTALHGIMGESSQEAAARQAQERTEELSDSIRTNFPDLIDALNANTSAHNGTPSSGTGARTFNSPKGLAEFGIKKLLSGKEGLLSSGLSSIKEWWAKSNVSEMDAESSDFLRTGIRVDKMDSGSSDFLKNGQEVSSSLSDSLTSAFNTGKDVLGKVFGGFKDSFPSLSKVFEGGMSLFSEGFGSLFKGISGLFSGGSGGAGGLGSMISSGWEWVTSLFLAKGGALSNSTLSNYSNSIVTSPTTFAFAKGAPFMNKGLMGESGPEAVLPLKRDAQGNLGIRGGNGGGETTVVVHNYGDKQATTKESKDSRGNRKIEVIIGDAVATEINRPGSKARSSIQSNFGTGGQLIRR